MSSDVAEASKRKRETPEEKPSLNSEHTSRQEERCTPPSSKRQKGTDSDSDSDCISQEDLLAQLGLNSVKKLKAAESIAKKVIYPEPPKQSILEFLNSPAVSKKMEQSPHPRKEKALTNGCLEEDDEGGDDITSKEKLIIRLQNNLRNEEAKLLLLRKLYACQNDKSPKVTNATPARTATVTTATATHAQTSVAASQRKIAQVPTTQKQPAVQQPPVQPRVVFLSQPRPGQPVIIAPKLVPVSGKSSQDATRDANQRSVRSLHPSVGPTIPKSNSNPNVASANKGVQRSQPTHPGTVHPQSSIGTTVNKPTAVRAVSAHTAGDKMRPVENGVTRPMATLNVMHSPSPPQQAHADAKLALRKQLERTLLQIPPPKPPVQDWTFVPSVNTQDFTILVGLEGVVNHIMESKEISSGVNCPAPVLTPPKFCSQCDTDFTPAWRKKPLEDDTKLATFCETCYTQKIKKTLKSEHTARLKAAFVKALKQEQEVDQKIQSAGGMASSQINADERRLVRASSHHQIRESQPRIIYHPPHATVHHTLQPQVYQPHHSIVHQLQQQQLQQQHQELENAHRQETRYFTYVGQHNCQPHKQQHSYTGDKDRQREYLLDMIPSGHTSRGYRI